MQRGIRHVLGILTIVLVIFAVSSMNAAAPPAADDLRSVVPGAQSFKHELAPLDFYKMMDGAGNVVGAAFITSQIPPEVGGYRGEIDVLVGIDTAGKITGTKLLGHNETPELMQKIVDEKFLSRFIGRKAGDNFKDIDAVTGATISSQAILEDIRTSAAAVAEKILATGSLKPEASAVKWGWLAGVAATILLVAGAVGAALRPKSRRIKNAVLVLSIVVIGAWLNTPVTIGDLVDLRNAVIPNLAKLPLLILMAFAIITPLWRGNLYCAYLCPFGALQAGAAGIGLSKCCPDELAKRSAGWLRWFVTIATIYAIAGMGSEAARTMEPFALCFSRHPQMPVLVQTGVVLAAALFLRRVWCRFMCPTGLVLDLFALVGAKVRHGISSLARRRRGHEAQG